MSTWEVVTRLIVAIILLMLPSALGISAIRGMREDSHISAVISYLLLWAFANGGGIALAKTVWPQKGG